MATDANDTVTIHLPTPGAGPQMRMVEIALIEESLTNPRKHFDQAKLGELAESIKSSGVHQPILLRPLPGTRVPDTFGFRRQGAPLPAYELVAGARRLRACKLAKVAEVPAMIRELTDDQALEIQLIENLQRVDMSELEEAEGYRALMEHSHLSVEQVAEKIGKGDSKSKGKSYVYARLKLLDLCSDATTALRAGVIDASRALRIARIPDPKLQAKALAEAARKNYRGDPAMGVREFEGWLQQNVMLRLDSAPFAITAIDLVPAAGSCKECPKRTGANPDLFADVNSPDLCTDPACYHGKEAAHSTALRAQAAAKGMRVIDGKEAKGVVNLQSWDGHGNMLKGYSRLDGVRHDVTSTQERATLRELLGDNGPQPVLIEHPTTKELIEAVPTDEAEAVLVQRGVLKTTERQINVEERIATLKQKSSIRQARASAKALYTSLTGAAHQSAAPAKALADAELLREWLKLQVDNMAPEDLHTVFGIALIEDEEYHDTEARAIARLDRARDCEVRCYMLAWLVGAHAYRFGDDKGTPLVTAAARALGIDAHAVEVKAIASEKEELREAIANLRAAAKEQAKAAKPAAPKSASTPTPAAPASGNGAKGKAKKRPAAPAPATPKTTAAEASAAIAAAMQAAAAAQEPEPGTATAAQGNDAQPVATAQAAAPSAKGKRSKPAAPAANTPGAGAQAASAPHGQNGADVKTGAAMNQAQPARPPIGTAVRVLANARGPKQAPHVGREGKVYRHMGATAVEISLPHLNPKRGTSVFVMFDATELETIHG